MQVLKPENQPTDSAIELRDAIKRLLSPHVDAHSSGDTGEGFGSADLCVTINEREYWISVKPGGAHPKPSPEVDAQRMMLNAMAKNKFDELTAGGMSQLEATATAFEWAKDKLNWPK